jgi:hypothetical protein
MSMDGQELCQCKEYNNIHLMMTSKHVTLVDNEYRFHHLGSDITDNTARNNIVKYPTIYNVAVVVNVTKTCGDT